MAKQNKLIGFAEKYERNPWSTLDAHSALIRLEDMQNEIETLQKTICEVTDSPTYNSSQYEIFSYYAVSFVTCLEWHARSRIVDVFSYFPDCIEKTDLDNRIPQKLFAEAIKSNLTLPYLLGATYQIGSLDDYLNAFRRVADGLQLTLDPYELLKVSLRDQKNEELDNFMELKRLFEFRHELVHEISLANIGGITVKDGLSLEDAGNFAKLTRKAMMCFESWLFENAPTGFPNKIDHNGNPTYNLEEYDRRIEELERQILQKYEKFFGDSLYEDDQKQEEIMRFKSSALKFKEYADASDEMCRETELIPRRYNMMNTIFGSDIRMERIRYLERFLGEFGDWYE